MCQGCDCFLFYFCFKQPLSSGGESATLCVSMSWMQNSFASLAAHWTPPTGWAGPAGHSAASLGSTRSALFVRLRVSRRLRDTHKDGAANLRLCPSRLAKNSLLASSRTNGSHVWPAARDQLVPLARHTRLFFTERHNFQRADGGATEVVPPAWRKEFVSSCSQKGKY